MKQSTLCITFVILYLFSLPLGLLAGSQDKIQLIREAKNQFEVVYTHTAPYKDYVIGVEISTLLAQKDFHNFTISHDESWQDFCLDVKLGVPLPTALAKLLPGLFLDFRVFYRVVPKEQSDDDVVVCTQEIYTCPDGTEVGRTGPKCEFVCPADATPTGGLSLQDVEQLEDDFDTYFTVTSPFSDYYSGIGISSLGAQSEYFDITLGPSETWEDYCLTAFWNTEPPADIQFPQVYKGVRVFYSVLVFCPDDVKLCPDGTEVGREGPNCEFTPCPPSGDPDIIPFPFNPVMFFLVLAVGLSVCCCCLRRRRCRSCRCQQQCNFQQLPREDAAVQSEEPLQVDVQQQFPEQPQPQFIPQPMPPHVMPVALHPMMMNGQYPMMMPPGAMLYTIPPPPPQQQQQQF